jgi:hypothetical protein
MADGSLIALASLAGQIRGRQVAEERVVRFRVPAESTSAVVEDMTAAGYDIQLLPDGEVRVWIFAHQSAFQAEALLKQLAPEARLISERRRG